MANVDVMSAIKGEHMSKHYLAGTLVALGAIVCVATGLVAQAPSVAPVDLRNATGAEVRDAQGQAVLRGDFAPVEEEDDDIERKAVLKPLDATGKASGDAEIEFAKNQPKEQEVEFQGKDLTPGAIYTLVIDGHDVTTATADQRGRLDLEVKVPLPGVAAP